MKSIFLCENKNCISRIYSENTIKELVKKASVDKTVYSKCDITASPHLFSDVEFIFSSWGMPVFTEKEIKKYFPSLKCVFYAAGTVQAFARPFLKSGVKVFSAWAANAVPVAEYTTAQIILANKGFFRLQAEMSSGNIKKANEIKSKYPGNYGDTVGIIGAGMIGKLVIKMLKQYNLNILVFDPFLPNEAAQELGVKKCSLDMLFNQSQVISNHLANNAQTVGMLNYSLFSKMPEYAVFLNTGRGAQVVEDDLVKILSERDDLTAVLDVTYPEPPEQGHAFYSLSNCFLTPHIAGSSGSEVHRMAEYMAKEYMLYINNMKTSYEVTEKMLETMA